MERDDILSRLGQAGGEHGLEVRREGRKDHFVSREVGAGHLDGDELSVEAV